MDLEGIVCKRKDSPYKVTEKPSRYRIKVKSPKYSQLGQVNSCPGGTVSIDASRDW
jgi:hypothetical protein